jgi:hypothetical protein
MKRGFVSQVMSGNRVKTAGATIHQKAQTDLKNGRDIRTNDASRHFSA